MDKKGTQKQFPRWLIITVFLIIAIAFIILIILKLKGEFTPDFIIGAARDIKGKMS